MLAIKWYNNQTSLEYNTFQSIICLTTCTWMAQKWRSEILLFSWFGPKLRRSGKTWAKSRPFCWSPRHICTMCIKWTTDSKMAPIHSYVNCSVAQGTSPQEHILPQSTSAQRPSLVLQLFKRAVEGSLKSWDPEVDISVHSNRPFYCL